MEYTSCWRAVRVECKRPSLAYAAPALLLHCRPHRREPSQEGRGHLRVVRASHPSRRRAAGGPVAALSATRSECPSCHGCLDQSVPRRGDAVRQCRMAAGAVPAQRPQLR
eukprot:7390267-Prymnesium_polylepis.3